MKMYKIYRDIRKRAEIFGLSVPLFALQMLGMVGSLLGIIFSFSFTIVFVALVFNGALYMLLLKVNANPDVLPYGRVYPKVISNKKTNLLRYGYKY